MAHLSGTCQSLIRVCPQPPLCGGPADAAEDPCLCVFADFHQLPLPSERFDLVVSYWCVHDSSDPPRYMKEIFRVLKPGGAFLLADGLDAAIAQSQEWHRDVNRLVMEMDQAVCMHQIAFLSASELTDLFHRQGLAEVSAEKITEGEAIVDAAEREELRARVMTTLERAETESLPLIAGGEARWGKRLERMKQQPVPPKLALQPSLVVRGVRPQVVENASSQTKRTIRALASPYLAADANGAYPQRFRELPDLANRGVHVIRISAGHGLDDDRGVAPDGDAADKHLMGLFS